MATQTIKFKGEFDVSSILNSIKQMRTELSKQNSPLLGNLDKEISKLETLGSTIKAQMEKGFASNKEFKAFESNLDKMELNLGKIGQKFKDINTDNLEISTKKINEQLEETRKKSKEIADNFKKNFNESMLNIAKKSEDINKEIIEMAKSGKSFNEAEKRANTLYDEKIKKVRELISLQKDLINNAKTEASVSMQGLNKEDFFVKGKRGSQRQISDEVFGKIQTAWVDSIKNAGGKKDAADRFRASLAAINKELGIEISREDRAQAQNKAMTQSWVQYTAALKNNNDAVSQHEKRLASLKNQENALIGEKSSYNAALQTERVGYEQVVTAAKKLEQAEVAANAEKIRATNLNNQQAASINTLNTNLNKKVTIAKKDATATQEIVKAQDNLNSSLDMMRSRIAYVLSLSNAFYQIKRVLTSTFNDVQNIDKAFASIAMVTDKTISGLWSHYDEYATMAQKLGQSTESAIKASALFYQQGLKDVEVMQLTEDTLRLATLAGLDFEQATSQMTAALRGFHMEMDQGAHITDVYSELAAHAAADVNGIAYAMSKTASIANNAGMSFENTAALLTQMIETTQEAPENIGTAMKTIIARFTELKKNIAGTAESEFEDLDYNKVDTALKSVGVSIKDTTGQFRNLDEVFLELSEKWNTLDRNSQRYIATIAAGSRQQSRFIAMMENYDRTMELINVTANAEGRSQKQFEKNADSVQFKLQQLKTAWEQFRLSLANSDSFKKVIDMLTNLVDTLNNLDKTQLVTIGLIGITLGRTVITTFIKQLKDGSGEVQRAWKEAMGTPIKDWFKASTTKSNMAKIRNQWTGSENYLSGARNVLGSQINNDLTAKAEILKTQELQNQLVLYEQLEAKALQLEQIERQAAQELATATREEAVEKGAVYQEAVAQQVMAEKELQTQLNQVNKVREELGYEQEITAENAKQISQGLSANANNNKIGFKNSAAGAALGTGLSSGISAALTTGIITALSGADFSTVLKTSLSSLLIAALPQVLSAVMPTVIAFLTGPAGIVVALGAAIGVAAHFIKKHFDKIKAQQQELQQVEIDRLKNVEKANKELQNKQLNAQKQRAEAQTKKDDFSKLKERYEVLSDKSFLTSAEETELESIVENLNSSYSELIISFDDNTKEIQWNTVAIEKLTETLDDSIQYNKDVEKINKNLQAITSVQNAQGIRDLSGKISTGISQYTLGNGITSYDNAKWYQVWKTDTWNYTKALVDSEYTDYNYDDLTTAEKMIQGSSELMDKYIHGSATYTNGSNKYVYGKDGDIYVGSKYNFAGENPNRDITQLIEEINLLPKQVKEELGLDANAEYTASSFNDWFINKGYQKGYDFAKDVEAAAEKFEQSSILSDMIAESVIDGVENHYNDFTIAGEKMGQDLAHDLATGIVSSEDEINQQVEKYSISGNILNSLSSGDLATIAGKNTNISKQDVTQALKALGFIDEDYKLDLDSYSEVFSSVKNFKEKFSELPDELKEYAKSMGYVTNEGKLRDLSDSEIEKIMPNVLSAYLTALKSEFGEISQETLEKNKDAIKAYKNLQKNAGSYTEKQYDEKLKEILNSIATDADSLVLKEYLEAAQKMNNVTKNISNKNKSSYANNRETLNTLGYSDAVIDKLNLGTQNTIISTIKNSGNTNLQAQKEFADTLLDFYKGINSPVKDILNEIDVINTDYATLVKNSSETILKIAEAGNMSYKDAERIYNDFINMISSYNTVPIQNTEILKQTYQTQIADTKEHYKELLAAQKEYLENGIITGDTYRKLAEAGFGSFVQKTLKGYELIEDRADSAIVNSYLAQSKSLNLLLNRQDDDLNYVDTVTKTTPYLEEHFGRYKSGDKTLQLTEAERKLFELLKTEGYSSVKEYTEALRKNREETQELYNEVYQAELIEVVEYYKDLQKEVEELSDKIEDLTDKVNKNKEAWKEAEEKLREVQHGSELFQSSLDGLINYNNKLKQTNNTIEDLKDNLEDISDIEGGAEALSELNSLYDSKTANLSAQNVVTNDALANLKQTMLNRYGNFVKFNGDEAIIDFNYINMDANDEIRKAFEKEFNQYNEFLDKKRENNKQLKEIDKEREKFQKDSLKNYVDIQKDVINILKKQAEEEINTTKEKYDALKEADDDYIKALENAIQKERELREKNKSEEELSQKEKKLSLMQRDTSGANAKDIQQLEKDISDDREKLLDNSIDTIINDMKEVYEKQAEARDAEIEYMESVTENAQYFNEWAQNIMSNWNNVEDMQDWFLQNNPDVKDMTIEQTEQYINDIQDKWKDLITYQSLQVIDFKSNTEAVNAEMKTLYQTTSENISKTGTNIQAVADKAADDAIKAAQKARDEAKKSYDDSVKELQEAQDKFKTAEKAAKEEHIATMNELVKASQSGIKDVTAYAITQLAILKQVDLTDQASAEKFAVENGYKNSKGQYSEAFKEAVKGSGGDSSIYQGTEQYQLWVAPRGSGSPGTIGSPYSTREEAEAEIARRKAAGDTDKYFITTDTSTIQQSFNEKKTTNAGLWAIQTLAGETLKQGFLSKESAIEYARKQALYDSRYDFAYYARYATGGLVPYTGIAQVDGSPSRPEAFLSAEDTQRFLTAAELFAMSPLLNSASAQNAVSSSIGDTSIEININVESISDDYDVDRLIKRVEDDINETARPVGTQVILNKRV